MSRFIQLAAAVYVDAVEVEVAYWSPATNAPMVRLRSGRAEEAPDFMAADVAGVDHTPAQQERAVTELVASVLAARSIEVNG